MDDDYDDDDDDDDNDDDQAFSISAFESFSW